jgi:signal transduction histidine kinase
LIGNGMSKRSRIAIKGAIIALVSVFPLLAQPAGSEGSISPLEIFEVTVNDKPVLVRRNAEVSLGSSPENIAFKFGARTNGASAPLRIRYKLEGVDATWRDGTSDMFLTVRFYNAAGDQISNKHFPVGGESAGWNGSLETSALTHRRETVVAPEQATRLWIVISSAGPPAAVGVYVVANLVVSHLASNVAPTVLLQSPFDQDLNDQGNGPPVGWTRDGNHSSMANIVAIGQNPKQRAFAILDVDGNSHAEWHNIMEVAPKVKPGEQILIEWNEAFSIGVGNFTIAKYPALREGKYRFQIAGTDIFGNPTGGGTTLDVLVTPAFWRTTWFWTTVGALLMIGTFGIWRYVEWFRVRQEMARLKSERALENERLRIAQDLHDDFGARATEISLASALAKKKPNFPESARADFDRISVMSRELVSALYETVWAVNPVNDILDALGNYLCQMINGQCEQAQLPFRLRVMDLPREIQVSSQTRHNVLMAVKEAVNNVIKHAKASEVTLGVTYEQEVLTISIEDNGCGFQATKARAGNGLANMRRRLADVGGSCDIESSADTGTTVMMRLTLKAKKAVPAQPEERH